MKKISWYCLKFVLLFIISISSSLAIYMHYKGSAFDPIREIQRLKSENRRDDALDLVRFLKENEIADQGKFNQIEKALEYTAAEKIKSFIWNGAIRGQVYDSYSGMGPYPLIFVLLVTSGILEFRAGNISPAVRILMDLLQSYRQRA